MPEELTVASAPLLLHEPPAVPVEASVMVPPTATAVGPVNVPALGIAVTVTAVFTLQPVEPSVNVIFGAPATTPVTTPVDTPTVAIPTLLLVHVPLPSGFDSVIEEPVQTVAGPSIADGLAITVISVDTLQPAAVV